MAFESIALRPSLAPVAKICPSAMFRDAARPEIRTAALEAFSNSGTALHAVFKDIIYKGLPVTQEALIPYCDRFNVTMDGYFGILWRAKQVAEKWEKVAQFYQNAQLEQTISCTLKNGYVLSGTPDLFAINADFGVIFDLKTGEGGYDYFAQVEMYALILHKKYGALGVKEYFAGLFYPMLEKYTNRKISAEYLDELEDSWCKRIDLAGVSYVMGPMCAICPRLVSCQAIIRTIDPLAAELRIEREITPYDIAKFRPGIKVMERIVERFKEVEKALLEQFGIIDLGDGYELFMKEDFADKLRPVESWRILTEEYKIPPEEIIKQLKFTKSAVKESARVISVPRDRNRGLAVTQTRIIKSLEEQGAIEKVPRREVSMRPKAITEEKA
jgi:hypothetical protein